MSESKDTVRASGRPPTRRRPWWKPPKRRVYSTVLFMHRWLSLVLGLVLVLVAGSGALLVYQHEIDYALNKDRYQPTPGDVGWKNVKQTVEEAHPGKHLKTLWWPRWNVPVYEALLVDEDGARSMVAVDPGTGSMIEGEDQPIRIMDTVSSFHTTLLSGRVGRWLVIASTVASVLLGATGVYLWWPGIRRFFRGFRIRFRGFYRANFDLHQVSGAVTAPIVLMMSLTGLALAFPEATAAALHWVTREDRTEKVNWNRVVSRPMPEDFAPGDRPDYDRLLARAHDEVPGADTFYVTFPRAPREPIHIRLQTGIEPKPFGITSRLAFDQYTGELIQVLDPRRRRTTADKLQSWIAPLHFGRFGGHSVRGAYILSCLVVTGLFAGGIYLWLARRRRRSRK